MPISICYCLRNGLEMVEVRQWLSLNPNLNRIEQLEHKPCKNLEELVQAVFQCWQDIKSDETANLVSSVPKHDRAHNFIIGDYISQV